MTWFKAELKKYLPGLSGIEAVEVEKATAKTVWIDGRMSRIEGGADFYTQSWEAAVDWLVRKLREEEEWNNRKIKRLKAKNDEINSRVAELLESGKPEPG